MALVYKVTFNNTFSIEEIGLLLNNINEKISKIGSIHDFNIENYEVDQALLQDNKQVDLWIEPGEKFNYIMGYIKLSPTNSKDTALKSFKKFIIELFSDKNIHLENIYVQDGQLIMQKNWVAIPD